MQISQKLRHISYTLYRPLRCLGFSSMLPVVTPETLTNAFKFYHDGNVRLGMSYKRQLYRLVEHYPATSRLQAYTLGCKLSGSGNQVVVTVS
ncbi:MAG TPA: hypothetical protein V6C57_16580, partial [Coleofasciculaceae cyanobacterium]